MPRQTEMNGHGNDLRAGTALRENVAGLLHDGITLAELQAQLIAIDIQEMRTRSMRSLVLIGGAAILALGTVPVLLQGMGWALVNGAGWSAWAAFLTVAIVGLIIAAGVGWIGWVRLKAATEVLSRSKEELINNVDWVKKTLKQHSSERPPRARV